jgi:spermidine synthase
LTTRRRLLEKPEVLILGVSGGADVLLALLHRAPRIDTVELNPQIVRLVSKRFAEFANRLYEQPGVRIHVAEARSFVAGSPDRYDLIQLPLLDSFATAAADRAFEQYLDHLRPGGYLAITRWLKLPPRDSLRLFATAVSALERRGIGEPGHHLALVRSAACGFSLHAFGVTEHRFSRSVRKPGRASRRLLVYPPSRS